LYEKGIYVKKDKNKLSIGTLRPQNKVMLMQFII